MSFIRRIPLPVSSLALGIAGLGNLLSAYSPATRAVCGMTAAGVVLLIVLRVVLDFPGVRAELASPASLAVFPAFFMALMLIATYLKPYGAAPAKGLWLAALALQLLLVLVFVARFVVSFKLAQVLPGWFLVFVGFVVASVTSPAFGMVPLGQALLHMGFVGYLAVFPVVVYRMIKAGDLPGPALPTVAIFAAPPSLCLVGYLSVTTAKQPFVVYALLVASTLSLLWVLTQLGRILRGGFFPSYAALTFPFVISATALKQSNLFLGTTEAGSVFPPLAVIAMDGFATVMVIYVLARYVKFLVVPAQDLQPAPEPATP